MAKKAVAKSHIVPKHMVVNIISLIVEVLLLIGLVAVLINAAEQIVQSIGVSMFQVVDVTLENALLLVVFIELYLSMVDFFDGNGRSTIYIIDATLSFLLRETIIIILDSGLVVGSMIALAVVIAAVAFARFMVTYKDK
ncbi:DUF373 superfamily multipass membrane protein [Candidatus Mancarchaeum acidiphilum]|uniref:DUF373 superfamily multipass membrane protein n=1 Tax=Candidatus Mancarchaeum acidiphilum TaxID=1920749 RepID=A0A218NMI5_9ARCH|nr:phosphate-starvation-inducible PsiE family protein [Candidatus Mancarchaeum acidiphilum]ASI13675.1 DUF373 superfamily multipass membrane protein [Candidatus Mancarchaeum acidiphilum]